MVENPVRGSTYALYPLRISIAVLFLFYGIDKLQDLPGTVRVFENWGIPLASLAAPLVATAEVLGGLGIFAGVLPRFSAAVLSIVMITAMTTAKAGYGYDVWGVDLVLLGGLLTILINGAGRPTLASVWGEWRRRDDAHPASDTTPA